MIKRVSDEVKAAVLTSIKRYPDKLPRDIGLMHGVSTALVREIKVKHEKELLIAVVKSKW